MDYAQRRNNDIGENVRATLELLEENGGPDTLKTIKFSVPTYQSCCKPTNFHENSTINGSNSQLNSSKSMNSSLTR